ncbi:uracil-DNA glycosylase-like protein [Amylostereum chailletii]|nr:uracil-DNA glycosylase-like protein [Amylostereum chailletii]
MMCGINPGHDSAKYGYHYAHRSNHFWRCLHLSGLTAHLHPPSDGHLLPKEYSIGLTNLIERPSAEAAEIDKEEFLTAVPAFLAKVCARRPRIVCFVGKVVWDAVQRVFKASAPKAREARFIWGLQPHKLVHDTGCVSETLFFVVPSTSARVVSHQLDDKVKLFTLLKTILESVKANTLDTASFAIVGVA